MPTTLPVPSRGALRALRRLALGTSCTIAFGAGLLTEDRRRRIHSAREVHDNARKLKSSRKYHSAGTAALETFEDQSLRYRDEGFWLPSNVLQSTAAAVSIPTPLADAPLSEPPVRKRPKQVPLNIPRFTTQQPRSTSGGIATSRILLKSTPTATESTENTEQRRLNRQNELAVVATTLLEGEAPNIDGAADCILRAFEEGHVGEGLAISPLLMKVAIQHSNACQRQSNFAASIRIFTKVLSCGPILEDDYHKFNPAGMISALVSRDAAMSPKCLLDSTKLKEACSIYLAKFKEKPKALSATYLALGDKLCRETCRSGMFDLTLSVYARLESARGGAPLTAVDHLITATHGKGHYKKVFRYYDRFYTQTSPDQLQFFHVTGLAIDSLLALQQIDKAEEVLVAATRMARRGGLQTSTTWLLRVLGDSWRSSRDIVQTQALFRRLEPLLPCASHPQAFYGAMIQFCVEAHQEDLALSYYSELRKIHTPGPEDLRIYGHFALAKAYRADWDGVREDFQKMKQLELNDDALYGIIFTPILKEFTKAHSVNEIEDFVRFFLVRLHLKTTSYIMNLMVDVYAKAHEVDAIARWINYAVEDGCTINAVTFNTTLRKCANTNQFSFHEAYKLYEVVKGLDARLINNDTIKILRSLALSRSQNQIETNRNLKTLKGLDDPVLFRDSNEVYRAMSMTFAKDNDVAVLKIYKNAQRDQIALSSEHLSIAVKASLRLHWSNIDEAARLIQEVQQKGGKVSQAISIVFRHQLSELYESGSLDVGRMTKLAESTINTFEGFKIPVPQEVLTHIASLFQRQGHNRTAIDFWTSMSYRLDIPPSALDLPSLTTLLQAYLGLHDLVGIRWVMRMLSANNLIPDKQFRLLLKNTRKKTLSRIDGGLSSDKLYRFLDVVEEALQAVKEMRRCATVDRQQAQSKVFRIMQTAIQDQELRSRVGSAQPLNTPRIPEDTLVDMSRGCQTKSIGTAFELDCISDVNMQPQRLLAAVGV